MRPTPTLCAPLLAATVASPASAQIQEYENEADYLAAIGSLGFGALVEDFEGAAWDDYRTINPFDPKAAPAVTSQGMRWSGNDWITTNTNWGIGGSWGAFTISMTGGWPESFLIESGRTLFGAGGWFNSNPDFGAHIGIMVDGVVVADRKIGIGHQFIGVIVPAGFTEVTFIDIEEQAAIGADNFTFAVREVCYPDCDSSGALDLFDFLCFQNAFALGDPYADCDATGALDFFDFLCFQNLFAHGCA
ncbi:MAG: hypothetical protein ACF8R7_03575 [Phycisphaerales bacterium JB039]